MNEWYNFLSSPQDTMLDLAKRVSQRRKEKKITQQELSRRADVSLGSIKRFERLGQISLHSLVKIAYVLGYEKDFESLFAKRGYASIEEVIRESG